MTPCTAGPSIGAGTGGRHTDDFGSHPDDAFGAGGGRGAHGRGDNFNAGNTGMRNEFDDSTQQGTGNYGNDDFDNNENQTGNKPSMGQKVKGTFLL